MEQNKTLLSPEEIKQRIDGFNKVPNNPTSETSIFNNPPKNSFLVEGEVRDDRFDQFGNVNQTENQVQTNQTDNFPDQSNEQVRLDESEFLCNIELSTLKEVIVGDVYIPLSVNKKEFLEEVRVNGVVIQLNDLDGNEIRLVKRDLKSRIQFSDEVKRVLNRYGTSPGDMENAKRELLVALNLVDEF